MFLRLGFINCLESNLIKFSVLILMAVLLFKVAKKLVLVVLELGLVAAVVYVIYNYTNILTFIKGNMIF
ncbi:MAG: hypothetical protein FH751_03580 [Firmicutes bacterium]|nr:hypothetical protein [Bacillota bacterium]